jgi:hypothetical protein
MALLLVLVATPLRGQIRSLQGVIGGEFEQYDFSQFGSRYINSYFREQAAVSIQGNAYNHNLADFTLQTRIQNTNATLNGGDASSKEHSLFINYYDLSVLLLKKTKLPISFYLRRDIQSTESGGSTPWAFSNRILTTAGGGQLSYSFNNGSLPTVTFGYDRNNSESVTPEYPFSQMNVDYTAGISQTIDRTTLSLNGLVSDRHDRIAGFDQIRREVRVQQSSSFGGADQLVSNGIWEGFGQYDRVYWNSIWNARISPSTINQSTFTSQMLQSPGYSNFDAGLHDQVDVELSTEWRAMAGGSLALGRIVNLGKSKPSSNSTLGGGLTYQVELGWIRPMVNARADFHNRTGDFHYRQVGGSLATTFTTVNLPFAELSIGDQIGMIDTKNSVSYSTVTNIASASASSRAIPDFNLNAFLTYTTSRDAGHVIDVDRADFRASFNATYQWNYFVRMYLTGGFTSMRVETNFYRQTQNQYSYEILIPELVSNLQVAFKGTRSLDAYRWVNYTTYDATLTYRIRLVMITGRWMRQSYDQYSRDYYAVTLSRPFGLIFE